MTAMPSVCGTIVLSKYTIESSSQTISSSLPVNPTLFVAFVALIANAITIFLIDLVGRKLLLVGSLIGTATGFFMVFVHQLTKDQFPNSEWTQFFLLIITIFMECIGILPVSHVFKMDFLPPKVRHIFYYFSHLHEINKFWLRLIKCRRSDTFHHKLKSDAKYQIMMLLCPLLFTGSDYVSIDFECVLLDIRCVHIGSVSIFGATYPWILHSLWNYMFIMHDICTSLCARYQRKIVPKYWKATGKVAAFFLK